jgi:hypothetical protein
LAAAMAIAWARGSAVSVVSVILSGPCDIG